MAPSPEVTPLILDALHRANAHAVFFVLGEAVDHSPSLVRRIVDEGHQIGIHGYYHRPFVLLSQGGIQAEVADTRAAICRACPEAVPTSWVRPPARVQIAGSGLAGPAAKAGGRRHGVWTGATTARPARPAWPTRF